MYIYRLEEITPLVTVKILQYIYIYIYIYIYYRLEEITPLVTGVKSYSMYITGWKKLRR